MRLFLAALVSVLLLPAQEQTHLSQVMGGARTYRVHLPPAYAASAKRYPVVYWLHGYEAGAEERDTQLTAWAARHEAIVIDSGPVETSGNYPLYLRELADRVDRTLRTQPGRDHRAVAGFGMGGFLALWLAANAPDLVGAASALSPARSAAVGPRGFEVDTVLEDLRIDYQAVRTRLFNSADVAAALDFAAAPATPMPRPAVFTHADPYPNFTVWGWDAVSSRRQPGVTLLLNVSRRGFHSVVREWVPGGSVLPQVRLTITSPRLFEPRTTHTVTYLRLSDHKVHRAAQRADSEGRLTFDLDGGEYEVGIGPAAVPAIAGYELVDAAWASAGAPVKLRLIFCNKGAAHSLPATVTWQSPTPGVRFAVPTTRVPALAPGESAAVPLAFTAATALSGAVIIQAAGLAIEIPLYPPAPRAGDFKILDEGDRDGHASPGETFALSLPEGRAELITSDPCVDTSLRVVEDGARFTHAVIRPSCEPGRIVHLLARTATSYAAIEFPIWYQLP